MVRAFFVLIVSMGQDVTSDTSGWASSRDIPMPAMTQPLVPCATTTTQTVESALDVNDTKEQPKQRKRRKQSANPIDLKERNKLSAANYRKKHKLYVEGLELEVVTLKQRVEEQARDLEKLRADIQAKSRCDERGLNCMCRFLRNDTRNDPCNVRRAKGRRDTCHGFRKNAYVNIELCRTETTHQCSTRKRKACRTDLASCVCVCKMIVGCLKSL